MSTTEPDTAPGEEDLPDEDTEPEPEPEPVE
jgi:hypothetical protein